MAKPAGRATSPVFIDLASESDDSDLEICSIPLPPSGKVPRTGAAGNPRAAPAQRSTAPGERSSGDVLVQNGQFKHEAPSLRLARQRALAANAKPAKLVQVRRPPPRPTKESAPAHVGVPQAAVPPAAAPLKPAHAASKSVAPVAASRAAGQRAARSEPRLTAVRLFELCTETLRLVKGRRLTAWDLHAALPRHVQVPMGHVTKVMLTVCGGASRPAQLQQHKPPPGTGGHMAWSWVHQGPVAAPPVAARYAGATAVSPHWQPPVRTPSATTAAAPSAPQRTRGLKRPRGSTGNLKQADLLASAAVELNDDITAESQRTRQANRLNDFIMQHLTQEQRAAHGSTVQVEQLQPVSADALAEMTAAQVLQEFQRRLDTLGWQQQGGLPMTPESIARSSLVLGLPIEQTAESKKRFRLLARVLHPDKCTLPGALNVFLALKAASSLLSSAGK